MRKSCKTVVDSRSYGALVGGIAGLLEAARRTSARAVNAVMTATYWEIGRRIVEYELGGKERAEYGEAVLARLSRDLTSRYGRGFGVVNLSQMKKFYLLWPTDRILQTPSEKSLTAGKSTTLSSNSRSFQTPSAEFALSQIAARFPLPWSAYVRLLAVNNKNARTFYETEALRAGWSVRQLDRQIQSQFYERTALSRNKAAMLTKGARPRPDDASFLLELGGDFCFVGRQRRLRIGDEWYRVDLLFYHRRLRCLMLIDLKLGRFTHADAGQMHTYLNYAAEHWTQSGENPPVGLILCAQKNDALVRYALGNLPNKVLAAEYRTVLPDEKLIAADLQKTRRMLERRGIKGSDKK
jgi:predicted nuclease of restriction endonuclease-like (RecB) superfamily